MASTSSSKNFEIFKFKSTGVVALCEEVTDFVRRGDDKIFKIDLDSARFIEDDNTFSIQFDYLPEEDE